MEEDEDNFNVAILCCHLCVCVCVFGVPFFFVFVFPFSFCCRLRLRRGRRRGGWRRYSSQHPSSSSSPTTTSNCNSSGSNQKSTINKNTMKIQSALVLFSASLCTSVSAFAPVLPVRTTAATGALAAEVDDKTEVREYFNTEGFNRWNKIYSDSDEVNSVQMDIRTGHDQTIDKILKWIENDGDIAGKSVCDCGCGVGSLAIPLAKMGACSVVLHLSSSCVCVSMCIVFVSSFVDCRHCGNKDGRFCTCHSYSSSCCWCCGSVSSFHAHRRMEPNNNKPNWTERHNRQDH